MLREIQFYSKVHCVYEQFKNAICKNSKTICKMLLFVMLCFCDMFLSEVKKNILKPLNDLEHFTSH